MTFTSEEWLHPKFQRWVDEARVSSPNVEVRFYRRTCPVYESASCAYPPSPGFQPTIYLHPPHRKLELLHEVGHLFDHYWMDDGSRRKFGRMTGGWDAEKFASTYAQCGSGSKLPALCALIRRVALRRADHNG